MSEVMRGKLIEILLVEDSEPDVFLTKRAFEKAKLVNKLHVARDGEEALAILHRQPPYEDHVRPDLILLDINLPRIDGREVLRTIKETDVLKRIPVIVLSGSDAPDDIDGMYDLHANSYVTKPVRAERLQEIVTALERFWMGIVKLPDIHPAS